MGGSIGIMERNGKDYSGLDRDYGGYIISWS